MLRRVRGRFGMLAPRVTVRAHIPWYWRVLVTILMLATAILLASWVYDIGRRFAGFDKNVAEQELSLLRERVAALEAEAEGARNIGTGSEASIQIEHTAQQKLGEQVKKLELENGRLREDMAAFESLASGEEKNETIGIRRIQVEPDLVAGAGSYHYRLLIAAPASRADREFRGRLQLVATIQQSGKTVIVNIPDATSPDVQKYLIDFKYFRRVEGTFVLPVNAVLKKLEARLMQGPTVVNSQQITM
jgi:hypothetical protein